MYGKIFLKYENVKLFLFPAFSRQYTYFVEKHFTPQFLVLPATGRLIIQIKLYIYYHVVQIDKG